MLTNDTCLFPVSFVNMSLSCTAGEECRIDLQAGAIGRISEKGKLAER